MLDITTHKYFVFTRKEFWFYNGEKVTEGTYNVFSAAKKINEPNIHFLTKYTTAIIDLTKPSEELFESIQPRIRRYIRAAEKQELECIQIQRPSSLDCDEVIRSFNVFAKSKKIPSLNKKWLSALIKTGNVCFTKVNANSTNIITHVYVFDNDRTIFTHTYHNPAILNERLRSDANQYLLWKDILFFKAIGKVYYDFGGVNIEKLPGISQFKLKFGGNIEEYYRYIKTSFIFFK